jgi:hypothetical protein
MVLVDTSFGEGMRQGDPMRYDDSAGGVDKCTPAACARIAFRGSGEGPRGSVRLGI